MSWFANLFTQARVQGHRLICAVQSLAETVNALVAAISDFGAVLDTIANAVDALVTMLRGTPAEHADHAERLQAAGTAA